MSHPKAQKQKNKLKHKSYLHLRGSFIVDVKREGHNDACDRFRDERQRQLYIKYDSKRQRMMQPKGLDLHYHFENFMRSICQ